MPPIISYVMIIVFSASKFAHNLECESSGPNPIKLVKTDFLDKSLHMKIFFRSEKIVSSQRAHPHSSGQSLIRTPLLCPTFVLLSVASSFIGLALQLNVKR